MEPSSSTYRKKLDSPTKWVNGMILQDNAENTAVGDIFEEDKQVSDLYGEDPRGPPPNEFDLIG